MKSSHCIGGFTGEFLLDELIDRKRQNSFKLSTNLKYVLAWGRCLGIIPLNNAIQQSNRVEEAISRLGSILGTSALGFNAIFTILGFLNKRIGEKELKAGSIAKEARPVLFILAGFFTYLYFLVRNGTFRNLFSTWEETSRSLKFGQNDHGLIRTSKIVSSIVLVSAFFGFVLQQARLLPIYSSEQQRIEEESFNVWKVFIWRSFKRRADFMGFNIWLDTFLLITNQLSFIATNFTDLLIILFARALFFNFRILSTTVQTTLQMESTKLIHRHGGKKRFWTEVRGDHLKLSSLLTKFESFLSPLIFVSFSLNLYSLCLQVHEAMLPSGVRNLLESAHSLWFGFHLLLRMCLVTYFGASLNDAVHGITLYIQKWPTDQYSAEMERLERYLGSNPIGLTGLNCFILSRPFVLVIFSILFTIEIVLLQAISAG